LSGSLERAAGENVGSYAIGVGSLANSNYNINYVGAEFTITAKEITVTADAQTKTCGDADPALTYDVVGLVGADTLSGSLEREAGEEVGTYAITQGSLSNSNYKINYVGAELTITGRGNFGVVVEEEISQAIVIKGTLLFNDGDGSVKKDFCSMGFPELVSMELKRTATKLCGHSSLMDISTVKISCGECR
jgi:hypothetical protein